MQKGANPFTILTEHTSSKRHTHYRKISKLLQLKKLQPVLAK